MKIGAENSKKTIAAVALLVVALFMFFRMIFGGSSSSATSATKPPVASATAPAPSAPKQRTARRVRPNAKGANTTGPAMPNLDPRLHLKALEQTESTEYTGSGRNIFLAQANEPADIPKPVATAFKQPVNTAPAQEYTPPPPPPIDLKFFGFASTQGTKQVFLARGDDVFVASEGDIVNRRYKIVKIHPTSIEVQDVLSNNTQTIPLTAG